MKLVETKLKDCYILEPKVFEDNRGWFTESYSKKTMENLGLTYDFVQDNHSFSKEKGVLRGVHFQYSPYSQAKLVRCTRGKILDIAVDLRKDSETYLEWISIELSEDNKKQLLIPKNFGHGFVTLEENTEVQYKADEFYNFESDGTINYLDPKLNILWNVENPILSEKDSNAPFLNEIEIKIQGGK